MVKIVQKNSPILREEAKEVPIKDIKTGKIKDVIADMKKALEAQEDGVAIAAPQIGKNLAIFIVSHRVFDILEDEEAANDKKVDVKKTNSEGKDIVFINPEILRLSRDKHFVDEGCLSVRWLYGKVERARKAKIRAYNEKGEIFEMGSSGLMAQIFQHETDHLKGVLFIDKATEIEEIPPKEKPTK